MGTFNEKLLLSANYYLQWPLNCYTLSLAEDNTGTPTPTEKL